MRVLVVAGSSGGHIFPALALLDRLNKKNADTLLVLPRKGLGVRIHKSNYRLARIDISPIRLSLDFYNLLAILKFILGSFQSLIILLRFHPSLLVGFGSLSSVPLILLGKLFGKKILLHEQNVVPGRANRLLAYFADRVAISFVDTRVYLKRHEKKIIFTGNPLRREMARLEKNQARDFFGFSKDRFTILVIGGSQGSYSLNRGFLKAVLGLSFKNQLQIIHLSGVRDEAFLKEKYRDLSLDVRLYGFFDSMQYAYSASDLVVCRAGATTLSEIIFYRIPAVIVPYPFAYQHQLANARVLEKAGTAVIIDDAGLGTDILKETLEKFILNPEKIKGMINTYARTEALNADELLANAVLSLS